MDTETVYNEIVSQGVMTVNQLETRFPDCGVLEVVQELVDAGRVTRAPVGFELGFMSVEVEVNPI